MDEVNIDFDTMRPVPEIRASERNLTQFINAIPAMAWSARPDGSAEFFNQYYLDYVGLTAEQAQGWGWTGAVHPDDLDGLAGSWHAILASGKVGETEARLRRFDGEYRWFLFRTNPLRDESYTIVKWCGTNTDIDDRKRAEEQLQRSQAFLVEGQRLSMTGTFSWRVAEEEITWSTQIYRIFEFDPAIPVSLELIGSRVHPDDMPLLFDMVERARNGTDFEYDHRLQMPDRSVKYLHLIGHPTRNTDGRLEYIGAVHDVTRRRLAEQALAEARSELAHVARATSLGVLTASIAHEINQPLSGIITNASTCMRMLVADPPNIKGAVETVRRTIRDGNRAADVVSRLRALFSKREAVMEPLDLNEAVQEVVALSSGDLQRSEVVVRMELDHEIPLVTGDRVQLQQVILNLLRNASDAMRGVEDRPRVLVIRTEPNDGGHVRLSVQDVGVGYDPKCADRLFEAFYTTKRDGMGMGLSVSRSIIESHHGRLWAAPNDRHGATFAFSIPSEPERATGAHRLTSVKPATMDAQHVIRNP